MLAASILIWLVWQIFRAKKFNQFKKMIIEQLKPQVITALETTLNNSRSTLFPNNECHQQATLYYWTKSCTRIMQAALKYRIIDEHWLKNTGNVRHCQHLFHLECVDLVSFEKITITDKQPD